MCISFEKDYVPLFYVHFYKEMHVESIDPILTNE